MTEQKEKTLEEAFSELEEITQRLESSEISLEESFQIYRRGMELLKFCNQKIDTVEKKMLQINQNGFSQGTDENVSFSEF